MLRISNNMIEDPGTKQKLSDKLASVDSLIGNVTTLTTNAKTSVVAAINENVSSLADIATDVKTKGLKADGTDDGARLQNLITSLGTSNAQIFFPIGTYTINTNVTIPANITLQFSKGAIIIVNTGATFKINGDIQAGNYEIFQDGGGKIDKSQSSSPYNLAWYTGASINKRFNFAKKDFVTWRQKVIVVPKPYPGQAGTYDDGTGRIYWACDDVILIDDNSNAAEWYIYGEFYAIANFDSFIKIQGPSKPENIYFYGTIQINIPAGTVVNYGINVCDGWRVCFYGQVIINGAQTSLKVGGTGQTKQAGVYINQLQCSFYTVNAILLDGTSTDGYSFINSNFIYIASAQATGTDAVLIRGLVRDFNFGDILYDTNNSKSGYSAYDCQNLVKISSYGTGDIRHGRIDSIYTTTQATSTALKITSDTSNPNLIFNISVNRIYSNNPGTAFNIDYCNYISIGKIENSDGSTPSIIGTNSAYAEVLNPINAPITDNGLYTLITSLGHQSRGISIIPSAGVNWKVGSFVRETTSNKVYMRISKTGTDATDFVRVNSGTNGIATIVASTTSIVVTHGMIYTPTNVVVTAKGNVGNVWVNSINSTQFTINCATSPASNTDVSWRAD